jgi:polyphosphate glucokinase
MRRLALQAGPYQRVAIGFPGVIHDGVVYTAHNLNPAWIHFNLAAAARQRLGKPVRVANDADVAGYGAVRGRGVELVITLGTGLGSALFVDGVLVPNLELAHHPWRKEETYEEQLGRAALDAVGKTRWMRRIRKAIRAWEALFNYDHLYLGGGNAKKIAIALPENVVIVPNREGLLGGVGLWR